MADGALLTGIAGMLLFLIAFTFNLLGRWDETEPRYMALNVAGAILLGFYAYRIESYPFLVLEAAWGGVAAYELYSQWPR